MVFSTRGGGPLWGDSPRICQICEKMSRRTQEHKCQRRWFFPHAAAGPFKVIHPGFVRFAEKCHVAPRQHRCQRRWFSRLAADRLELRSGHRSNCSWDTASTVWPKCAPAPCAPQEGPIIVRGPWGSQTGRLAIAAFWRTDGGSWPHKWTRTPKSCCLNNP